jgi:hypothetical protein
VDVSVEALGMMHTRPPDGWTQHRAAGSSRGRCVCVSWRHSHSWAEVLGDQWCWCSWSHGKPSCTPSCFCRTLPA